MMAENSAELADVTILTAEDPRTESLDEILAEMAAGRRTVAPREIHSSRSLTGVMQSALRLIGSPRRPGHCLRQRP